MSQNRYSISVIAPMFNEEANIATTFAEVKGELVRNGIEDYEIIFVNDGSKDQSWAKAKELAEKEPRLKVAGYATNQGRGKALRTGIDAATGDIIVTIDFDLTYDANHIGRMITTLDEHENVDVVLASCYMPGGKTLGIPPFRLFVSRLANKLYQYAYSPMIYTSTCVVRAYRKHAIKNLELASDDKEIHLEILSKLLANGYKVMEIPGVLERRREEKDKKRSTFKFKAHSISHVIYFIQEKPFYIFGFIGFLFFNLSLLTAGILLYSRFGSDESFNNTFISRVSSPTLVLLFLLAGMQMMGIGFLGIQNNLLKREMFRMQRMTNELLKKTPTEKS